MGTYSNKHCTLAGNKTQSGEGAGRYSVAGSLLRGYGISILHNYTKVPGSPFPSPLEPGYVHEAKCNAIARL